METGILKFQWLNRPRKKAFVCHSEARFSPKNLSVYWTNIWTNIEEGFFASLRMTAKLSFSAAAKAELISGD